MPVLRHTAQRAMSLVRRKSGLDPLDISSWSDHVKSLHLDGSAANGENINGKGRQGSPDVLANLNDKLSLWQGDITEFQADCIVNAANKSLLGGGGDCRNDLVESEETAVDGAIHRAAGPDLKTECATLHGCATGEAKLTKGYRLPAKHVIHTVGPIGLKPDKLRCCYWNCLEVMKNHALRTIVFPCISTGVYGYPQEEASIVAIQTVREWLDKLDNASLVDRIVFCVFEDEDLDLYEKHLPEFFPPSL